MRRATESGRVVDAELARIAQRIRDARDEAGLTLQELAQRSGVATSTIQKVETAQMVPSVAVVLKIARGLGRSASELLYEGSEERDVIHLRARHRHRIGAKETLLFERLSGDLFEPGLEMWRVTLAPGASSRGTMQYRGEEIAVGERGTVIFVVGDREYTIRAGDTLHFKASIPHEWRNDGDTPARFTVTGTLPRKLREAMHGRVADAGSSRSGR